MGPLRLVVGVVGSFALVGRCGPAPVPVATFNIENFPRHERQITGAFAALRALDAPVIALQEVTSASRLQDAVRRELGPQWGVAVSTGDDAHRLAVLWDTGALDLVSVRSRDETRVRDGLKPTLEVRLRDGWGRITRVLAVHLKAGGAPLQPVRAAQLAALDGIVAEGRAAGDRVVLLGDFNSSTDADRSAIAALAERTGLSWASEPLACTSYWDRDQACLGVALDHVLVSGPGAVSLGGACASEGCAPAGRCPSWRWEVSDHCPLVVR
ncbi:MAG: endonuclease/exonuclease/phosphatase family protein [Myxococcota bacterium]